MIHIYNQDLEFITSLNYDFDEFKPHYYSKWKDGYIVSKEKREHPKLVEGEIVEKTREERILIDNEKDLLEDGEYVENGKIITVPRPTNRVLNLGWDKELHIWKEMATQEELERGYVKIINELKPKVLELGCEYTHADGQTYRQKLRPHKDLPLVASSISFLEKYPNAKITWSFDDDHTGIEMTLEDLNKLEDTGVVYTNAVYDVERDLKSSEVNLDLAIEDYVNLVKEKLNSFTFSLRGVLHE